MRTTERRNVITIALVSALGTALACTAPQTPAAPPPSSPAVSAIPPVGVTAPRPAPATAPAAPARSALEQTAYGKADGKDVWLFTLANAHGLKAKITNYGATLTALEVPDRNGKLADIVLGFDDLAGYQAGNAFFGATVGRVANRIRNATFSLEGKTYHLAPNDPPHALHGGPHGFSKVVWEAQPKETPAGPSVELTYVSKDGEEGYPGTVTAKTTYTLTDADELKVEMVAVTDRTTLVNLANHSYWNLAGNDAGPITDHELTLFADSYTPGDPMVPTGVVKPVKGTPFDFTAGKPIGRDLKKAGGGSIPIGYDHNFVINGDPNALRPIAKVREPKSGRVLTLEANQPGLQFYSGNFLNGSLHGKGATYAQYTGFCLETQKFPNAINVPAWRDQVVLKPGETYRHVMIHRFSVE